MDIHGKRNRYLVLQFKQIEAKKNTLFKKFQIIKKAVEVGQ